MSPPKSKPSVLFVCLGNICRSPLAEGAFRAAAERAGLNIDIASAGTASYHIGQPPDPRAIAVAGKHGVDITEQRGRQIGHQDFYEFTHIFALDTANLEGIKAHAPRGGTAHVSLLMNVVEGREGESIKDPYHGDEAAFQSTWDTVSMAVDILVKRLLDEGAKARF